MEYNIYFFIALVFKLETHYKNSFNFVSANYILIQQMMDLNVSFRLEVFQVPFFYLLHSRRYTYLLNIELCIILLPVVQLSPIHPAAQEIHDPSVCRHVSGLQ